MSLSDPFIRRPVATTLLTVAVLLAGAIAFTVLPVAPLPQVDFPTISVNVGLPGASPETMASSAATPLERQFGRIAGVTEMTSSSSLGGANVTLQFDLDRNIDAAARDVMAAINAAHAQLPQNLPTNPGYHKVNPADAPVLILAMTSDTYNRGHMYDFASTILAQKISQVEGVGQVTVGGSSLPAVRVELNPPALNRYGIGLQDVKTVLSAANANAPKGRLDDGTSTWGVQANDQLLHADDYRPLIVAWRNGAPVRVGDVAEVDDAVEDLRNAGFSNGKPSVLLVVFRQPGANIIEMVDRVHALLPQLRASIPRAISLQPVMDRTVTIRAAVHDVELTLVASIGLVILVVHLFLGTARSTLIPGVAVPVSIVGTFGVMYLFHYSIDNLSLMALTIATGFVVDDAIVVLENITRHVEAGMTPMDAARRGASEIGFTVLSMSLSLIAVFIPILLMGGIVGRLFREFAVTLSASVLISLVISLTATPTMCARLLRPVKHVPGRFQAWTEGLFAGLVRRYDATLGAVLRHSGITLLVLLATVLLNVWLFSRVPKGFFPDQDTGRLQGSLMADQATSFQAMQQRLDEMMRIVQADPAVDTVTGFTGGGGTNSARVFVSLKPLSERKDRADVIIARLRPKLAHIPGGTLYMQSAQDLRVGGRAGNAAYQYTLQGDDLESVRTWAPKLFQALRHVPELADVNLDQQDNGRQVVLAYDRPTAARLGITSQLLDSTLYDAFGQSQVSTMYVALNQYHVVMEAAPRFWQSPETLRDIYVKGAGGAMVPLSALSKWTTTGAPLQVNHQGQFPAVTLSFNLPPGIALSQAVAAIEAAKVRIGFPATIRGGFQGTAKAFQDSLRSEPWLIAAALAAIYIVLGMLYEDLVHPVTILSTLPSAGVGALLALLLTGTDLSLIAMIGILLLIGIVKKNAILMVDFAIAAEREEGKSPFDAIREACLLRLRPILMTTMAAMLGALPLALGLGNGAELRRPLGITIIGGLLVSQVLTLYTTPVVYLALDRARLRFRAWRKKRSGNEGVAAQPEAA